MKRYIFAALAALIATPALAITQADLYDLGTCTYNVETGRPKMDARILTVCPTNVWYECGNAVLCCDVEVDGDVATVTLPLKP